VVHRLAPQARTDLDEIWDYVFAESGSEPIADRVIDQIVNRFILLSRWPRLGRPRRDLRRGLRSHTVGNYLIFYRIVRGGILILRVLHGRRDIGSLLRGR
jgi:toxin ParE1/3/4